MLQHYADLFTRLNIARDFANSLFVTLGVTLFSLVVNSMAGYAFAKLRFGGRDGLFKLRQLPLKSPRSGVYEIQFDTSKAYRRQQGVYVERTVFVAPGR